MELQTVFVEKPADVNLILGQSHFIKTVETCTRHSPGAAPATVRSRVLRVVGAIPRAPRRKR